MEVQRLEALFVPSVDYCDLSIYRLGVYFYFYHSGPVLLLFTFYRSTCLEVVFAMFFLWISDLLLKKVQGCFE